MLTMCRPGMRQRAARGWWIGERSLRVGVIACLRAWDPAVGYGVVVAWARREVAATAGQWAVSLARKVAARGWVWCAGHGAARPGAAGIGPSAAAGWPCRGRTEASSVQRVWARVSEAAECREGVGSGAGRPGATGTARTVSAGCVCRGRTAVPVAPLGAVPAAHRQRLAAGRTGLVSR